MPWFNREGTQDLFYKDELKPRPSHKLTLPKGTIFKGVGNILDVTLLCDIEFDFLVTHNMEMGKPHMDYTNCQIYEKTFPVYMMRD